MRGFTLIEVLLVVILIGIVSAVAAPRFSGFVAGQQLSHDSSNLATLLRRARMVSDAERLEATVVLWPESREYRLAIEDDPFDAPGVFRSPGGAWGRTFRLSPGVSVESVEVGSDPAPADEEGGATIAFEPGSLPRDIRIVLTAEGETTREVCMRGLTGRVTVTEGEQ